MSVRRFVAGEVRVDPVPVANAETRPGDEPVAVLGPADDGHVGFDAAAGVAELGIGARARLTADVGDGQILEKIARIRSGYLEFGERALIDQHHAFACGPVFAAYRVHFLPAIVAGLPRGAFAFGGEPDGSLPAECHAIYPATRHLPLRVRSFLDFVVESMSGDPPEKDTRRG